MSIIELEDTEMSDLVAIIYPSEAKAEEVRQRLFKLQKEYLITISDAVIAVKTEAGPIKLNQIVNTTAIGAVSGSFWGLLIGVIFLNPILGVALGAASGALGGALSDYGLDDAFMKDLSGKLQCSRHRLTIPRNSSFATRWRKPAPSRPRPKQTQLERSNRSPKPPGTAC